MDDAAFDALLQHAAPRLMGLAVRMLSNPSDADDVLQEAFFRAWRHRDRVRENPEAWLRQIVARECLRALRWRAVRRWLPFGEDLPDLPDPSPPSDLRLEDRELRARIQGVVARLSPQQRLVWGLRFDEGWTIPEIAAATALRPDTVKTHLGRALAKVHAEVADAPPHP